MNKIAIIGLILCTFGLFAAPISCGKSDKTDPDASVDASSESKNMDAATESPADAGSDEAGGGDASSS